MLPCTPRGPYAETEHVLNEARTRASCITVTRLTDYVDPGGEAIYHEDYRILSRVKREDSTRLVQV